MGDFALVICSPEPKEPYPQNFIYKLKTFVDKIKKVFKKQKFEEFVKEIKLYDDLNVYIIKLPYTKAEIMNLSSRRSRKVNKLIYAHCYANNILSCILPSFLSESWLTHTSEDNIYNRYPRQGHLLYKSLLVTILDEICSYRGILIGGLDFSIVQGASYEELFKVVKLLSPHVKYITIVTSQKEEIEYELNNIYADTGLSIRVTSDYSNAFKDIDIIINLGKINDVCNVSKVNTKAIILNYGNVDAVKLTGENIIVNGIEATLPERISKNIPKETYEYFSKTEFAEMVLAHKIQNRGENIDFSDNAFLENMSKEFKKEGYKIKGFTGRHGILKMRDIGLKLQ